MEDSTDGRATRLHGIGIGGYGCYRANALHSNKCRRDCAFIHVSEQKRECSQSLHLYNTRAVLKQLLLDPNEWDESGTNQSSLWSC
jgi:hypothetical protein